MTIGTLYNTKGVVVGQAAGFTAPENTPLPPDHTNVFDETVWLVNTINLGGATGGTYLVKLSGGPLAPGDVRTTAPIAQAATAAVVKAAIDAVLPAGVTSNVTGAGPYSVSLSGPAASRITLTTDFTALTGATNPALTTPLWTPSGATEQGWSTNYGVQTQDVNIEEQQTPVGRNITAASWEFVANLAEDTIASLQLAYSATKTIQAADATHYGYEQLALNADALPVKAVALETKNRFGLPRLIYVPSATCAVNVGQSFRRAAGPRLVPVTFSSICDVSSIIVREIKQVPTP